MTVLDCAQAIPKPMYGIGLRDLREALQSRLFFDFAGKIRTLG